MEPWGNRGTLDVVEMICMAMSMIGLERAKRLANERNLKPGKVTGTSGVQFTKGNNKRLEIIDWEKFGQTLSEKELAVYESNGWMKIMKKR